MSAPAKENTITTPDLDQLCINTIRTLALDAVQKAESGHPGLPLGAAPMAYVLWTRFLRHNPKNPKWENRDRFLLSAGHGSMLLYSLLYLTGYDLSLEELQRFRQWGSKTPGHPEYGLTPGVEITTGPLGQGFANGVGMAMGAAHLAAKFNQKDFSLIDHNVYAIVSHGDPPGEEAVRETKRHLGWPEDKQFYVPEEALAHFRKAVDRGAQQENEWKALVGKYEAEDPKLGTLWRQTMSGDLPEDWETHLPTFENAEAMATRVASGQVINALAPHMPMLIGGSADLGVSNNTDIKDGGDFEAGSYDGRILHFGVREHAMGATLTGMSLNGGLIPYGGTFMTFSDYMRPSIRLACLSGVQVIYVFTHDSIGLGEDGPTHQPIEHLAALRAIPHLFVIRPADVHEVREAWRMAILRRNAPTALALTRQKVPLIDREHFSSAEGLRRGGYVLAEAEAID